MSTFSIRSNATTSRAYNNLSKVQSSLNSNIERLSSGLRINSASDDSAGSSVAVRMVSQINGMKQANANAQQANNLLQTAESGLSDVSDILGRMRELAVQAGTDTLNDDDRDSIDLECQALGDEIDRISEIDTLTGEILGNHDKLMIFPAKHFMTEEDRVEQALLDIEIELQDQIEVFRSQDKLLEAQRIEQRTRYDLEMIRETGYCQGIENYSRHFTGLKVGEPPYCLVNYFPDDLLIIIDESHVTVPQINGMYKGDRSRKKTLVDYGFRLPSALDNRPLRYEEFEALINQVVFVSATPSPYELEHSDQIVQQIIRPTGLIDPKVSVHPVTQQVDHLIGVAKERITKNQRVLVTTLTKQTAEDLSEYFIEVGIKANYLHSDIDTLERAKILKELRQGTFDVLIGINLLREGLDLPEVSLVAVLDADQAGFLRSKTSLTQTAGRAARNIDGEVILYADNLTPAIEYTINETKRRRKIQMAYNEANNITPVTIQKVIRDMIAQKPSEEAVNFQVAESPKLHKTEYEDQDNETLIAELKVKMQKAAIEMKFEEAASFRDQIVELEAEQA